MSAVDQTVQTGDIERRLAELETVRLLLSGLAHDFNNLLTAIAGHASLLETADQPGDEVRESAAAILKATERASAIAEKLLGITRRGDARRAPADLHETIDEVAALLGPAAGSRIRICRNLKASASNTLADPNQMHQLILNLALNACEAMPDGGLLTFETDVMDVKREDVPYLIVTVKDTGRGIPREIQGRIFEPYFTTREGAKGTGLGLTIASQIVKKHNGFIRLESEPGHGSAFRVYLPLLAQAAAHAVG